MRRAVVIAITAGLLAGAVVGPAEAKKKKPVTFSAEGSLMIGNPGDLNEAGLARQEFLATCGVPTSQGVDGYVVELDDKISAVNANVEVTGSDATGSYDLDVYFYDDACTSMGGSSTGASDEFTVMPAGTRYAFVSAFLGAEIVFEFKATQLK